jgi:hypothetical protein
MTVRRKQNDAAVTRGGKGAGKVAAAVRASALPDRDVFRTVLIPSVGWPTEDMATTSAKRPAKR